MVENITCMNLEDSVYLDIYKIEGTINADQNPCFQIQILIQTFKKSWMSLKSFERSC